MTEHASIRRQIVALALPASAEAVLQICFSFVDQVVIARLGNASLAAVGLIGHMTFLSGIILGALSATASILVAQHYGRHDGPGVARTVGATVQLALLITVPLAVVVAAFAAPILTLMGVEPAVVEAGAPFLRVIAVTVPLSLVGSVAASALRSLGDARTPMVVTLLCVATNTVLNFVLVFGWGPVPAIGVMGAAYATLAAQVLRSVLMVRAMAGARRNVPFRFSDFARTDASMIGRICRLTWPIALTEVVWSLGSFLYTLITIELGTVVIAANQVVVTTEAIFVMASSGLSAAALTLIGQAIGADDEPRLRRTASQLVKIGLTSAAGFGLLTAATSGLLGVFFREISPEALHLARVGLVLNAVFQWVKVMNMVLGNGVLRAGGDNRFVLVADVTSIFVFGLPIAFFVVRFTSLGLIGVLVAKLLEEGSRVLMFAIRYRSAKWRKRYVEAPVH
ncbi:MAG TPA: MATE family efflux transporter [Polyangiaceae bacterium]|nr:MATE family efflux transporter [Polyangiaceae bacterium]